MPCMGAKEICETAQMHIMLCIISDVDGEHRGNGSQRYRTNVKRNAEHTDSHVSEMYRAGVVLRCWPSWSLNPS